jgi:glucosyl-dolichyl phosphate glucuronosyltransferase
VISVILCTYNRCQSLAVALESVAAQVFPRPVEWEVLVVDNNSKDQTRQVAERFCREHPGRFRYVFEPRQGKSFALNTGIQQARGAILAFVDDDVTVAPDWLACLTAPLYDPHWAGTGGRIVLNWTCAPPRWLRTNGRNKLEGALAAFDQGSQPCELAGEVPLGTNMAFRREMFTRHGGFRTDLGPTTGSLIRGEDTEFGRRLLAAGERLYYEPAAVVYHPVVESRVQKQYFQKWFFANGRAVVRERGVSSEARFYWGVPRYLFRRLAAAALRWVVTLEPYGRFCHQLEVWQRVGEILESRRQSNLVRRQSDASKRLKPA